MLWKSGELELSRLNKTLSAFEYFNKTKFFQQLSAEISDIRSIDAELKQNREVFQGEFSRVEKQIKNHENEKKDKEFSLEKKSFLDEKFNEKQKQLINIEAELKNMMRDLDLFEEEQGNNEVLKKENTSKLAKLSQMIEFSNITLKEYESTLKEKKSQYEESKRNLLGSKVDSFEEAGETINKQLEQAEKKYQENQNHVNRLRQNIVQIKEQMDVEKSAVMNSLNNRYVWVFNRRLMN